MKTQIIANVNQGADLEEASLINGGLPILNQHSLTKYNRKRLESRGSRMLLSIFLMVIVMWIFHSMRTTLLFQQTQASSKVLQTKSTRLPKIFWIYTRQDLEGSSIEQILCYRYNKHILSKTQYEVRVVNSWTANDWLSISMLKQITKTIQNTKIDQTVDNLLKLALLIQHGGILLGQIDTILLDQNLHWLQEMFTNQDNWNRQQLGCDPIKSEIFLPSYYKIFRGKRYLQNLMAATPGSKLLKQVFKALSEVIVTGVVPYDNQLMLLKYSKFLNINYLADAIEAGIKIVLYKMELDGSIKQNLCVYYGFQEILVRNHIDFNIIHSNHAVHLLLKNSHRNPKNAKIIINFVTQSTTKLIEQCLKDTKKALSLPKDSLIYNIFQIPGNKEIFLQDYPERNNLELCLIVPENLTAGQISQIPSFFQNQTYQNWKLILFASDITQASQPNHQRQIILQSSFNQVRNIEVAATQHCSHNGYAILMHFGDTFNSEDALSQISTKLSMQRGIVGASIDLKIDSCIIQAKPEYLHFSRTADGIHGPNISLMEGILNHMRIFAIDSFRYIPQFQFRNIYGEYFKDRLIFLMALLQMVRNPSYNLHFAYLSKKLANVWNMPDKAILMDSSIYIKTAAYESLDREQLIKTKARYDVQQLSVNVIKSVQLGISFEQKMMVFNKGTQFVPVQKKTGPDLIPKVIYSIWVGGPMPASKKYFFEKAKKMYPSYTFKMLGEGDITPQAFPVSYEIAMNLLDYQKHKKPAYSKYATVVDILRAELLYRNGGFWRDTGTNLFRPVFDNFLKYQLVVSGERTLRHRWNLGMGFFANIPLSKNIERLSNIKNVNRFRVYGHDALVIAGPINYRQMIFRDEEQNSNILVNHYEYFFAGQLTRFPYVDLCVKHKEDVKYGELYDVQEKGWVLLSNCAEIYPQSFGLDHDCFGVSWRNRLIKSQHRSELIIS